MNKHTHTHTQYTGVLHGNPKQEKTKECVFLYVLKKYIHWKQKLPFFPSSTGRRLQPPSFSCYNLREAPTPQLSSYNMKKATTPYVLWLQLEGGYNHLSLPCPTVLMYK
jgi:hypothetical protein